MPEILRTNDPVPIRHRGAAQGRRNPPHGARPEHERARWLARDAAAPDPGRGRVCAVRAPCSPMRASATACVTMLADADITEDAALSGRLILRQPRRGHRFGMTRSCSRRPSTRKPATSRSISARASGAARAGASRPGARVRLVEVDATLADLARENAARNSLPIASRSPTMDIAAARSDFAEKRFCRPEAHHVLMIPPFNDPARQNVYRPGGVRPRPRRYARSYGDLRVAAAAAAPAR